MAKVRAIAVPRGSLLAQFGPPPGSTAEPYRDCFMREVSGEVAFEDFVTRFYSSWAFTPERIALSLIDRGASTEDARKLAHGEADSFAAWNVVARSTISGPQGRPPARRGGPEGVGSREESLSERMRTPALEAQTRTRDEILLQDFSGATASWLSVEAGEPSSSSEAVGQPETSTRLLFGSWVGRADSPLVKALMPFHRWYSRVLLGGV